jgi:hypothetical protein
MKLLFERWSEEQNFSIKANNLFQESFICYKNNAYRASLLFSYLGFLTHIKEVIIKTPPPASLKPGRWTNLLANLQNDDTWEKAVYEEITNSSNPIFNIKEDLRLQVKYWKDRRNDAAHFKSNE